MTVEASSILDEDERFPFSEDDGVSSAAAAFLRRDLGEADASTEETEEAPEARQEETGKGPEENTEGSDETADPSDPDNQEVEIKVGEETKKATLKDLKRLYGQEASLTQKSQKLAEAQRAADAQAERASVALEGMLKKATERFKPYEGVDWLVLSQQATPEEFQALRADAIEAQREVLYLQTEVDGALKARQEAVQKATHEAAQECIKVLSDPVQGIPNWSQPLYNEMIDYAKSHGLPEAIQIVNPVALKLLHKAMLYDRLQSTQKTAQEKVKTAVNTAKRVLKPTNGSRPTTGASAEVTKAMSALRKSGSLDDAVTAFLVRDRAAQSND